MSEVSLDSISNLSPELQRAFQAAQKAEAKPIHKIEERKNAVEEKVKLLGDVIGRVDGVRSLLPNLNSPIAIRELAFASGDDHVLTGTADKNEAEPGKHSLEVLQLARSASALSNRFEDADRTQIGSGYFSFTDANGDTQDIYIDAENSTLNGVARIINSSRMGVQASVVRDETDSELPFRLILKSDKTGAQGEVEFPEFYFVDGDSDFFIEEQRGAANARIRYEGFDIESPTNEIKDLIRGVTLNVRGTTMEGRPVTVSIEQDIPKTTVKVKDLVGGLNNVFSFIQQQNSLDEKSNTAKSLGGDYGIRMAEDRLRNALRENFLFADGTTTQSLQDLGIQFQKNGLLTFDEKKFEHALASDFDGVVDLLAGDGRSYGVIPKLTNALKSIAGGPNALLTAQKKNYVSQVDRLSVDMDAKEKRAEGRINSLKERLAKAQAAITKLQSQQSQFTAQGAAPAAGPLPLG